MASASDLESSSETERIIALIDLDCFYVQVEQRDNPDLWGKPTAVVQYTQHKGGGIIAVNYEARALGVKRGMWGQEAKLKCPDLNVVQTEVVRGKANLTKYRNASSEVFDVLSAIGHGVVVEKASIDEAYLDLTEFVNIEFLSTEIRADRIALDLATTCIVGKSAEDSNESDLESFVLASLQDTGGGVNSKLIVGAMLMERIRKEVKEKTQFSCSAGISYNKILAKLACAINKPNKQTLVPPVRVPKLFETTPVTKCRSLGGKLGALLQSKLAISTISDLGKVTLQGLMALTDRNTAEWLMDLARGIERSPVVPHRTPKSIGSSKNFFGTAALKTTTEIKFWLTNLSEELVERLEDDRSKFQRLATSLTVGLRYAGTATMTRVISLSAYDSVRIVTDALKCLQQFNRSPADSGDWTPPVNNINLSASKFVEVSGDQSASITSFFHRRSTDDPNTTCESVAPLSGNPPSPKRSKLDDLPVESSAISQAESTIPKTSSSNTKPGTKRDLHISKTSKKRATPPTVMEFFAPQTSETKATKPNGPEKFANVSDNEVSILPSATTHQSCNTSSDFLPNDIDPSVWKELPSEIQWELRSLMKKPNKSETTRTIQDYFRRPETP